MTRIQKWESILAQEIKSAQMKEFQWGSFDCCLFVCDVVLALTGVDMAQDFRGKYSTEEEAGAVIKEYAGAGLAELCDKRTQGLAMPSLSVQMAGRGDVVLLDTPQGDALGIVGLDARFAWCVSPKGVSRAKRKTFKKAWKV